MNGQIERRVQEFTDQAGIRLPILLAPMAGACPPALSIAVANAGGLGACGALLMSPEAILSWCDEFRRGEPWRISAEPLDTGPADGARP